MDDEELRDRITSLVDLMKWFPVGISENEADELMRGSEQTGDPKLGFDAATCSIYPYVKNGAPEKAVVAFSRCLAYVDREGVEACEQLLIPYKWIVDAMADLPQVPWLHVQAMEKDFGARLEQFGFSSEPLLYCGWKLRMAMGHLNEAQEMYERWGQEPRVEFSDCEACCENAVVRLLVHQKLDEQAVVKADSILQRGLTCGAIPSETHAEVLLPLMRLDRLDDAEHHHDAGMRMLEAKSICIYTLAKHLIYLLRVERRDRALKLLEENLEEAAETSSVENRLYIYRAAWFLFDIEARADDSLREYALPGLFDFHRDQGRYQPSKLAAWFQAESVQMQQQYDTRNGNRYYTEQTEECQKLLGLV